MANPTHLSILAQGVNKWNEWRKANPGVTPELERAALPKYLGEVDLTGAYLTAAQFGWNTDLSGANLSHAHLSYAHLARANLREADLSEANLSNANLARVDLTNAKNVRTAQLEYANLTSAKLTGLNLSGANLVDTDLVAAKLGGTDLRWAKLLQANLSGADLTGADLGGADLRGANLTETDLTRTKCLGTDFSDAMLNRSKFRKADLTGARIYGISAWDLDLEGAVQRDLVITPREESTVTVDDIEVAQFIYLLLNNDSIRKVIDTVTSKVVLILGRFTPERKAVLDSLRKDLRQRHYLPVVFDFEKSPNQTRDETIATLAGMARFVIADLTDAKSILQELRGIVPSRPMLPVQPILLTGQKEPGMFDFFRPFPWVLATQYYESPGELLANVAERLIEPAERKVEDLRGSSPD
jgi:uncharacterized protein YjbI with pentapeptide repeats